MHEWLQCESCNAATVEAMKGRFGPFATARRWAEGEDAAIDLTAVQSP